MLELLPTISSMPVPTSGGSVLQQRHRLPLHVRTHQGAVGVVVLEERDQRRRDADDLLGRNVDVLDLVAVDLGQLARLAGQHQVLRESCASCGSTTLGGAKTARISSSARRYAISSVTLPFLTLRYGRQQEAVLVDAW